MRPWIEMYMWIAAARIFIVGSILISGVAAAIEAGFQIEPFEDSARARPILIDWWYPVVDQPAPAFNYGLGRGHVVEAGAIAPGVFPLIVLSHGAFGAARNYSWIAERLARSGFIVAGISHFGESYVYGAETIEPAAVLTWWERPLDASAAVTYIINHGVFSKSVDAHRIGFIGHSSGGATAMALAGVRFDGERIAKYCLSAESKGDRGCDYADSKTDDASTEVPPSIHKSYADSRIQVFVALDPALGPGFVDYSQVDPALSMLIVGSVENDFLPFKPHAQQFAASFPNAQSHWLGQGEGHFVYLNTCDADLEANGVPLCVDRPGVSRAAVHETLAGLILPFFNTSFKKAN